MPSDIVTSSVAAGASTSVMQGRQYEVLPAGGVAVGILAEATGILATVYLGSDLVLEEAPVPIGSANQIPVWPDHYLIQERVYPGTKLKVQLRNTAGATIVTKTVSRIG